MHSVRRRTSALQVPPVVPHKALGNFPKAFSGTTGGTYSALVFRPVMYDLKVTLPYLYRDTRDYCGM